MWSKAKERQGSVNERGVSNNQPHAEAQKQPVQEMFSI